MYFPALFDNYTLQNILFSRKALHTGILFSILLWTSCLQSPPGLPASDPFAELVPKTEGHIYFAKDTTFLLKDYVSKILFRMKEPDFGDYKGNRDFVRFVWLPSFGNAIVVRAHRLSDTVYAHIKELKNDSALNTILKDTTIQLGIQHWHTFTRPLQKNRFWTMAIRPAELSQDGATWFMESKFREDYRVIEGWDTGKMNSDILRLYANPLILFAEKYVNLLSSKIK